MGLQGYRVVLVYYPEVVTVDTRELLAVVLLSKLFEGSSFPSVTVGGMLFLPLYGPKLII